MVKRKLEDTKYVEMPDDWHISEEDIIWQTTVPCSECDEDVKWEFVCEDYTTQKEENGVKYVIPYCSSCWEKIRPRMTCGNCGISEDDPKCPYSTYPITYNDPHLYSGGSVCPKCFVNLVGNCWCNFCIHRKMIDKRYKKYFDQDKCWNFL